METTSTDAQSTVHHSVYVVELSDDALDNQTFGEANPDRDTDKPCLYVGMTGLAPEKRFQNHKRGYKASRWVRRYGRHLRPDLYEHLNPMSYESALRMERDLAQALRADGYAVWQK